MTAATKPDIAPRLVDGEPVCSGSECRYYAGGVMNVCSISTCHRAGLVCAPGLRRQRDAAEERARAVTEERDAARRTVETQRVMIADAQYETQVQRDLYDAANARAIQAEADRDAARRELFELEMIDRMMRSSKNGGR